MKRSLPILFLSVMLALAGCVNWADKNKPIDFIPELLNSIAEAKVRPIQLTGMQKSKVFSSLAGPVKDAFMAGNLKPEIYASWSNRRNDMVTLVRYSENEERYVFLTYDSAGRVFAFGGGQAKGTNPPWLK